MPQLERADHSALLAAWARSTQPPLRSQVVAEVLVGVRDGVINPSTAERWATLMRHGYLQQIGLLLAPVDIDFEHKHEDAIIDAIGYLEDISDERLGGLDPRIIQALLTQLGYQRPTPGNAERQMGTAE